MIYLLGSLRNPRIPETANALRAAGHEVYDDWYATGPEADDYWQAYEKGRGRNFQQALHGWAARHVFENDMQHLQESDTVVLVAPAGKSGHLELGWAVGAGKRTYILLDEEPERFDVMYRFVIESGGEVVYTTDALIEELKTKPAPAIDRSNYWAYRTEPSN